ncbi:MAG: prolipoprotein diacylglyceryl transferase [archaeon]
MAIDYIYHPILLQIGPVSIFTWGFFAAMAFLAGILLSARYGKKRGIPEENVYGLCFYILLGAIVGSRLLYVLGNIGMFIEDPLGVFKVWNGGMIFIGGLFGGILGALIFIKRKKLNGWVYFDLVAPYIALGHAIGRIGCVLGDGGHLGKATNLPWGIMYEGVARHPGALYEIFTLLILFFVLIKLRKKKNEPGILFQYYIIGYSIQRFMIDFLRADTTYYGLTGTQWGLIGAATVAILIIIWLRKRAKKEQPKKEEETIKE